MLIFATQAAGGIMQAAIPVADVAAGPVIAALVALWCKFDANDRNVTLPPWNFGLVLFAAIVGLPVYFFRTMSPWAAARRLLKIVGLLFGSVILAVVLTVVTVLVLPPNYRWSGP